MCTTHTKQSAAANKQDANKPEVGDQVTDEGSRMRNYIPVKNEAVDGNLDHWVSSAIASEAKDIGDNDDEVEMDS